MNRQGSSHGTGKIADNFRPVQALNGRKIFSSVESSSVQTTSSTISIILCITSILVVALKI